MQWSACRPLRAQSSQEPVKRPSQSIRDRQSARATTIALYQPPIWVWFHIIVGVVLNGQILLCADPGYAPACCMLPAHYVGATSHLHWLVMFTVICTALSVNITNWWDVKFHLSYIHYYRDCWSYRLLIFYVACLWHATVADFVHLVCLFLGTLWLAVYDWKPCLFLEILLHKQA